MIYFKVEKDDKGTKNVTLEQASEKEIIKMLEGKELDGGLHISEIYNPSVEVQKAGLKQLSDIRFIARPDRQLFINVIKKYPFVIQYYETLEERFYSIAGRTNGLALEFMSNPSEKLQITCIRQNPYALQFSDCTEEMIDEAINLKPDALRLLCSSNEEILSQPYITKVINRTIDKKPSVITLLHKSGIVPDITDEYQDVKWSRNSFWKRALTLDPMILSYLSEEHQTEEICRDCVNRDYRAFSCIRNKELSEKLLRELFEIPENISLN